MLVLVCLVTQFAVLWLNTHCTGLSGHCLAAKYRGRVFGLPVPCAGDPGFKSGPRDRPSCCILLPPVSTADGPQITHVISSPLLAACRSVIRIMKKRRRATKCSKNADK